MPALPVEFTRRAAREVEAAADWWRLNRPGAPGAVHSDLRRSRRGDSLHLGDDVVVPDRAGWRRERLPEVPNAPWTSLAPDWVCEVASPSTERLDRVEKLRSYARAGVSHAWLVNPSPRTLEIFRRHGSEWTLVGAHGGEEIVQVEPFDAIEWHLGLLWGGPGA